MKSNTDEYTQIDYQKLQILASRILNLESQNLNTKKYTTGDIVRIISDSIRAEVDKK